MESYNHSLGVGGSGPNSTDFYEHANKGGEYFSLSSGFKNLPPSWQNRISSVSTASPTASYSTTLWEHTSTEGYGKGVVFKHADWYGKTVNLNDFATSAVEVKSKNTEIKGVFTYGKHLLFPQLLTIIFRIPTLQNFLHIMSRPLHH